MALEERGACFNSARLTLLLENPSLRYRRSSGMQFLVERMLSIYEMQKMYSEAWNLALKAYNEYLPVDRYAQSGLIKVFYNLIAYGNNENIETDHTNRSVLSTSVKLRLLSQSDNTFHPGNSYDFRQWLSNSLQHDQDPEVVWITLHKGSTDISVQIDDSPFRSIAVSTKMTISERGLLRKYLEDLLHQAFMNGLVKKIVTMKIVAMTIIWQVTLGSSD
ncbi:hypothetical protein V8C42DRAFT_336873 [Trichoderma barbatum]